MRMPVLRHFRLFVAPRLSSVRRSFEFSALWSLVVGSVAVLMVNDGLLIHSRRYQLWPQILNVETLMVYTGSSLCLGIIQDLDL